MIKKLFLVPALAAVALAASVSAAFAVEAQATAAVNVRSGPGTGNPVVDTLFAGEAVEVEECNASGTWCRITHPGPDGWVSASYLTAPSGGGGGGGGGPDIQFGVSIPLPGGGTITFGTGGATPTPPAPPPPAVAQVCVYDLPNYAGASVCLSPGYSDPNIAGAWNNRVSSLQVFGGASIRFCQNPQYGGFCNVFASNTPALGGALNNQASSLDVMPPNPSRVCVYDLANYQGNGVCVPAGTNDNSIGGFWNNRITSIRLFGGATIKLCQGNNYSGFCNTFGGDVSALGAFLDNQASSYQTW